MSISRGFEAGFGVTSRALKGRDERKLREQLGQEGARYDVTEGAYGQGLGENIQQVQDLQRQAGQYAAAQGGSAEDIARAEQQYAPSIQELTRRQGLTAPDYSVGSRETNFGTRQEARQAASPMRTEGLSNVYRQAGEIEKADELEARAFEQQRGLARAKREDELFPLQRQQLEGQIASQAQQQKLGELTLKDRERLALEQQNADAFQVFAAQNQNATVQELKDAAFKQFKFTPKQWQDTVNTRLGIEESEQKSFVLNIKNKLKGKTNLSQYAELYNTDPDFDDKTDLAIVPGKKGAVTLNFVDKATGRVTGSETFDSQAKAIEYLNKQATEPETIGSWMLNLRTKEAAIAASERSGRPSPRAPNYREYTNAAGQLVVVDMNALPRGKDGQPVLPTGLSKAGSDKPVDVPEPDKLVKVNGRVMKTDGMGGYVAPNGIIPADRTNALAAAGVDKNLISQVDWAPDGLTVGFRGTEYDPKNPRDMAKLNDDYRRLGANDMAVAEAQRNTPGQRAQRGLEAQRDQDNMPLYFAP